MDFISSTLLGWLAGKGLESFTNAASKSQFIRKALQKNGISLESKNSDFETLYVHTLIRFFVESDLETRGYYPVFAEKEVQEIVHEALISNNREQLTEEIEEVLVHGLQYKRKYKKLGKSNPTIRTFSQALDLFVSVFNRMVLEQAPIFQLLELHEQRGFWETSLVNQEALKQGQTELKEGQGTIQKGQGKTQSKIEQLEARLAQLEEEKTFPHQIKKYLEYLRNDFQNQFLKPSHKYVPLIGHQKQETTVHLDRNEAALIRGVIGELESEENIDKAPHKKWVEKMFNPIDNYFQTVLNDSNPRNDFIVMLGEYGTGKTTFFKFLAYSLSSDYMEDEYSGTIKDPKKRIPILIPLRNYNGEGMEKFIISHLNELGVTDLNRGTLKKRLSNGEFILFLDGFDEMISREAETRKKYHADILKDLLPKNEDSGSLVILSSRIEYFKGESERDIIFGVKDSTNKVKVDFIHLDTFTDTQIKLFLERNKEKRTNVDELYEQIQTIFDLKDLAKRAVLLELIIKYLPTLMKKRDQDAGKIRSVELYKEVFDKEIERVKKEKFEGRYFLKRKKKQMDLLRKLALQLYATNELVFTYMEAKIALRELMDYGPEIKDIIIEADLTKFLTFSFLLNDGENQYRFSHKSFRDYLVAEAHYQEIQSKQINEFGRRLNTDEVTTFISEFNPGTENIEDWINDSRSLAPVYQWRGTNALKVFMESSNKETALRKKVISKALLFDVDFSGWSLEDTVLVKSDFEGCIFDKNTFDGSLRECFLRNCRFYYWGTAFYKLDYNEQNEWIEEKKIDIMTENIPRSISQLKSLTVCDFSHTNFTDIKILKSFDELEKLFCHNTPLNSIEGIQSLASLKQINISYTKVNDITPVSHHPNLSDLGLRLQNLTDISPLGTLDQLESVDLTESKVGSLKAFEGKKELNSIDFWYSRANDISWLSGCEKLSWLNLEGADLESIEPLSKLTELYNLRFSSSKIKDISPLANLKELGWLAIEAPLIEDFSPLVELTRLRSITIGNNDVKDISFLKGLKTLYSVNLENTLVDDLSPLSNLTQLKRLNIDGSKIDDIRPLQNLYLLNHLELSNSLLVELSPISQLPELEVLDIWGTNVMDISALHKCPSLRRLNLPEELKETSILTAFMENRPNVEVSFKQYFY